MNKTLYRSRRQHSKGTMMKEDRYYVQRLTEQVFLVRERRSSSEGPGANDSLIRSFDIQHDAALYADDANEKQKKLDEQYGHWTHHAINKGD